MNLPNGLMVCYVQNEIPCHLHVIFCTWGCSYHLHASHCCLSTWGVVKLVTNNNKHCMISHAIYQQCCISHYSHGRPTRWHSFTLWTGTWMGGALTWIPSLMWLRKSPSYRWGLATTPLWSTAGEVASFPGLAQLSGLAMIVESAWHPTPNHSTHICLCIRTPLTLSL